MIHFSPDGHVDDDDLSAYRDGTLDNTDMATVGAHLAECGECSDVVEFGGLFPGPDEPDDLTHAPASLFSGGCLVLIPVLLSPFALLLF